MSGGPEEGPAAGGTAGEDVGEIARGAAAGLVRQADDHHRPPGPAVWRFASSQSQSPPPRYRLPPTIMSGPSAEGIGMAGIFFPLFFP